MTSVPASVSSPPSSSAAEVEDRDARAETQEQAARALVDATEALMLGLLPQRLNVGAFAAEHGLSLSHLERLFREVRGASSYRVFLLLRLQRVEQLAVESKLPLRIASARCGFGHFGVFRRAFIAKFGREPTEGVTSIKVRRRRNSAGVTTT